MKLKKVLSTALLFTAITTATTLSFADTASNNTYASGGWSEYGGYYSTMASAKPESHTGGRNRGVDSNASGNAWYTVWGKTAWKSVMHTTTAQLQLSTGKVVSNGTHRALSNTYATSSPKYYPGLFENTEARTYYKKS